MPTNQAFGTVLWPVPRLVAPALWLIDLRGAGLAGEVDAFQPRRRCRADGTLVTFAMSSVMISQFSGVMGMVLLAGAGIVALDGR